MLKTTFLDLPEVKGFSNWLQKIITNEHSFSHSYQMETKGKSNVTIPWKCDSIYNAYDKYSWPFSFKDLIHEKKIIGKSFSDSQKALSNLEDLLKESLENNNNELCFKVCAMILDWGGVLGSTNTGNLQRLALMKPYICTYLTEIKKTFNSPDVTLKNNYNIEVQGTNVPIIMNAGFTKIYSLLCKNFIIYDGRVGATFGLLVRLYYENNLPNDAIPKSLSFYYGRAKNKKVNRNPSNNIYEFKALSSVMHVHIKNNLKANWIIQRILNGDCGKFSDTQNPARSIESALFMIGYRMPDKNHT
jgi:hypothetical protein